MSTEDGNNDPLSQGLDQWWTAMSNSRRWMEDLSREVRNTAESSLNARDLSPVIDTLEVLGRKVFESEGTNKELRAELGALSDRVTVIESRLDEVVNQFSHLYSLVEVLAERGAK
jgi:hypothetical protein